ncbi:hypothetical protein GCM10010446_60810 [Streptomyces enissocaesilis]|uniref:Uncharacterized protein n=1 Tax=Streptomyces enissocaesilis TaxID=332589 RepID=A0ABP6K785_9ACTN
MGELVAVSREDGTGCFYAIDPATNDLVGNVIPSDVHRGKWRASVIDPVRGVGFVCVTGTLEALVEHSQVGTDTFSCVNDALRAISRHRMV